MHTYVCVWTSEYVMILENKQYNKKQQKKKEEPGQGKSKENTLTLNYILLSNFYIFHLTPLALFFFDLLLSLNLEVGINLSALLLH